MNLCSTPSSEGRVTMAGQFSNGRETGRGYTQSVVIHRKIGMVAGACAIVGAAEIGSAGSAQANPYSEQFQSPSGDISCNLVNYPPTDKLGLGKNFVQCDIVNQSWLPPRPPPPGRADATSTLVLMRGQLPIVGYGPGTLAASDPESSDQPISAG